jgi:hypothetical protein
VLSQDFSKRISETEDENSKSEIVKILEKNELIWKESKQIF